MSKTVFDVEDIRKVRRQLADEYGSMSAEDAQKLQTARVDAVLSEIFRYRRISKELDISPNNRTEVVK